MTPYSLQKKKKVCVVSLKTHNHRVKGTMIPSLQSMKLRCQLRAKSDHVFFPATPHLSHTKPRLSRQIPTQTPPTQDPVRASVSAQALRSGGRARV